MSDAIPARPKRADYLDAAVDEWVENYEKWNDKLTDEERADIKEVFRCGPLDGYAAAQDLDFKGWVPTAQLVGYLDGFSASSAQRSAYKVWMVEHSEVMESIRPTVGTKVAFTLNFKGEKVGVVTSVNDDVGEVTASEDLDAKPGSGGWVLTWERLEVAT